MLVKPWVAYPRWMSDIPHLLAAIESRLADIAAEIIALDAAKTALAGPRTGGQIPAVTIDAQAPRPRHGAPRRRLTPSAKPSEPATARTTPEPVAAAEDDRNTVTPKRSSRKRAATATRPRPGAVRAETLERLLAETSAGLSANAIAKQAGAPYNRSLTLLRELEAAGQVRRSGSRRSTVWQLITDEERIAERAAELERRSAASSRRRASATTS
jgi:hypothetical protein